MANCPFCNADIPPLKVEFGQPALYGCRNCMNACLVQFREAVPVAEPVPGNRDLRDEAPAGSVIAGVLEMLDEALDALPVLPEIPQRILAMVHDPLVSMNELADLISKDAVISVKLMKMANSAFYSSPQAIRDLTVACSRLGLKLIANTTYAAANNNLYQSGVSQFRGLMQDLWRHSLATAHCAFEVGVRATGAENSLFFEAGLIHDVGKLVLLDIITKRYKGNVGRLRESRELLLRIVRKFHALVGLHVAQHWQLSPDMGFSALYHNDAEMVPVADHQQLTDVTCLANELAHALGYGLGEERDVSLDGHPAALRLGFSPDDLASLQQDVADKVESLVDIFSLL